MRRLMTKVQTIIEPFGSSEAPSDPYHKFPNYIHCLYIIEVKAWIERAMQTTSSGSQVEIIWSYWKSFKR
jgi:hypothetical protein